MNVLELTVSRTIGAAREKVFNAWLSPDTLARFMHTPQGSDQPSRVTTDPVEGGRFSIVMISAEREIPHAGTYLEIVRPARLSFTWESPYSLDDSVVTVDFVAIDRDTTEVTIRQVRFAGEPARLGHIEGWTAILGNLDRLMPSAASAA